MEVAPGACAGAEGTAVLSLARDARQVSLRTREAVSCTRRLADSLRTSGAARDGPAR